MTWHRLTLDLWLAKDNRFLNPKSSYKRILMAPSCRFIWFPSVSSPSPYVTHVTRSAHHSCRRRVERTEGNELWGERQAVEPSSVDCDGWCLVSLSPFLTSWLDPSSFVHHPSHLVPVVSLLTSSPSPYAPSGLSDRDVTRRDGRKEWREKWI